MTLCLRFALLAWLLLAAVQTRAEEATITCPPLPAAAGLSWEAKNQGKFLLCRAMAADGRQAFGIMLSSKRPAIRLTKEQRAEQGMISGKEVYWYYPDSGGTLVESRRITIVEFDAERFAQIWIEAVDEEDMHALQQVIGKLALAALPVLPGAKFKRPLAGNR
ncbi:MAG: hypothetical protein ABW178_12610 [Pseudoxanthomonas sp.]